MKFWSASQPSISATFIDRSDGEATAVSIGLRRPSLNSVARRMTSQTARTCHSSAMANAARRIYSSPR
jgi:hypothetical protein